MIVVSRLEAEVFEALRRQGLVELPGHFVWLIRTVMHLTPFLAIALFFKRWKLPAILKLKRKPSFQTLHGHRFLSEARV